MMTNKHFRLVLPQVNEICQPFFDRYGFSFFMYVRFFYDESFYGFTTNPEWNEYGIEKNIVLNPPKLPDNISKTSFFILWEGAVFEWVLQEIKKFNIHKPLAYIEVTRSYCDLFTFGVDNNNKNVINTYLNQFDILKKFSAYFKEQSSSLIPMIQKSKIIFPTDLRLNINSELIKELQKSKHSESELLFELHESPLSQYLDIKLSKQEFKCLKNIAHGKTAKECARLMNLSPKTVENYIYNMKSKLGVHKKNQLIDIYYFLNDDK